MDERYFSDTYDLYRPTVATDSGGVQAVTEPGTATATDQPCLFFPAGSQRGRRPGADIGGLALEFDAVLRVPYSADLRPDDANEHPDHVHAGGNKYLVEHVHDAAGRNQHKIVGLTLLGDS